MFSFLPKPIYHVITDLHLGGAPPRRRLADFGTRFGYGVSFHAGDTLFDTVLMDTHILRSLCKR